jgi:hypothetical protein
LPALHQIPADNLVQAFGLEPVDHDGPRDAAGTHVAQAAWASGRPRSGGPCGFTCNERIVGSYVSPTAEALRPYGTGRSAAVELARRRLDGDRDSAATVESESVHARLFAAEMVLPVACPAGCPRAGDRRLYRRHRETWKP